MLMRKVGIILLTSFLIVIAGLPQSRFVVEAKSLSTLFIYQGDLVIDSNNVTSINGDFEINGSIIVKDNATLILNDVRLIFTQNASNQFSMTFTNASNGRPRFLAENATITGNGHNMQIEFAANSTARMNGLTLQWGISIYCREDPEVWITDSAPYQLRTADNAVVNIENSTIDVGILTYGYSIVDLTNCTCGFLHSEDNSRATVADSFIVSDIETSSTNINCNLTNYKPSHVSYWNFRQNCSVIIGTLGEAPNVTVSNTEVGGWGLSLHGFSNATIHGSELQILRTYGLSDAHAYNSSAQSVYAWDNSKIWFINSMMAYAYANDQSKIHMCWYLVIRVQDVLGNSVPSANVTVYYNNGTLADSKLVDLAGYATFTLVGKVINTTGENSLGSFTVVAAYQTYSNDTAVNMTNNMQVSLILSDFTIPEYPQNFVALLLIFLTLLMIAFYARKHTVSLQTQTPKQFIPKQLKDKSRVVWNRLEED